MSLRSGIRFQWKFFLALLWLVFTLTFAGWWMYVGLHQVEKIQLLLNETTPDLIAQKRMMIWEGAAWMALLVAGGTGLIWLLLREERRSKSLEEFFASFSHEIKTAITSLRLQAESLKEDLGEKNHPSLNRLVADTVRLHLQLENSLFLAQNREFKLYLETLPLNKLLRSIRHQWPDIEIELNQDAAIQVDERAMKTVLSNLIHNAVIHGQAHRIEFKVKRKGPHSVELGFHDDGIGFQGDPEQLGKLFYRHNNRSGSGVGLYIAKDLVQKMNGNLQLEGSRNGFSGKMELRGNLM